MADRQERVCPECGCNRQVCAETNMLCIEEHEGIAVSCIACGFEITAKDKRRALDAWDDILQVRGARE